MGKVVALGEVVADVYREEAPSEVELPFTVRPGGAPANVAVAAARLGAEAAFVGRLGDVSIPPQPEEPPDPAEMERMATIAARYGAEILGPLPGQ